jgi:two-component system KDP operon response regulator KdpE
MHEKKNTILIVDDEPQICKMLSMYLDISNFNVEQCDSGKQAVRINASIKPNLILLDLGLPDMNGKEVIGAIREWSQVPIIVLTACTGDSEVVAALSAGADDYIVKPFNVEILLARINANLRKAAVVEAGEPELVNGAIRMDLVRHEVYLYNEKISLTPKEYELLRYMIINRGKMLTHKQILKHVWGPAHVDDTQYLRVYMGQLRDKIEKRTSNQNLIITEPGVGYRMDIHQEVMAKSANA